MFDRFSDLSLAGQLGLTCAAPPYAAAASLQAAQAAPASQLAAAAAPGKARSSMNLSMISGR